MVSYGDEMAASEIRSKQTSVDATGSANHSVLKSNNRWKKGGWVSHACVELYIVNDIEEGVSIHPRLFINDGITSLEKLNAEVF
jgi:hypothetical protein